MTIKYCLLGQSSHIHVIHQNQCQKERLDLICWHGQVILSHTGKKMVFVLCVASLILLRKYVNSMRIVKKMDCQQQILRRYLKNFCAFNLDLLNLLYSLDGVVVIRIKYIV